MQLLRMRMQLSKVSCSTEPTQESNDAVGIAMRLGWLRIRCLHCWHLWASHVQAQTSHWPVNTAAQAPQTRPLLLHPMPDSTLPVTSLQQLHCLLVPQVVVFVHGAPIPHGRPTHNSQATPTAGGRHCARFTCCDLNKNAANAHLHCVSPWVSPTH